MITLKEKTALLNQRILFLKSNFKEKDVFLRDDVTMMLENENKENQELSIINESDMTNLINECKDYITSYKLKIFKDPLESRGYRLAKLMIDNFGK